MPGIMGIISYRQNGPEHEKRLAAMVHPLVFTSEQEVEWFRHDWYYAGTVGYGRSFSFLKKSSAYKQDVLLIMDGEVFPDVGDVPHELVDSAPTIQRAEYCLYLYLQHGPQFVQRLNGLFVIAVFDNRDHTVHLYNDRFGSEALYVWTEDSEFVFATSQRTLLTYRDDIGRTYDKDALAELVLFERVLGNKTLFKDIRRLVPASHAVWDGKQLNTQRYWDIPSVSKNIGLISWKDAAAELNHRLAQSMAKRLADNAHVAALVSGGIDSRLLLCHCPKSTVAVTFADNNLVPSKEVCLARCVTQTLGHEHNLIHRNNAHYAKVAELAVDINEGQETFVTCHSLGLHQQMLNSGIQVVLTGLHWDVLLKGYYSLPNAIEHTYPNEPSDLYSRRLAWHCTNTGVIRKLHIQHLMMLALNNDMKERAAIVKERVVGELSKFLSTIDECPNRLEHFLVRDWQSRTDPGFQRSLRTCFLDRSLLLDNDIWAFATSLPAKLKRDGRIVRYALRLANPRLAWIKDANTGLPAGLCPPWNRVLGNTKKVVRNAARWLSHYSKTIESHRKPLLIFPTHSSWPSMNAMLLLCDKYRSMIENTIEQLDETVFDKNIVRELFRDDLNVKSPRFHKLFEIVLTFGLFDRKWGPSTNRNAVFYEISDMKCVDLRSI